MKKIPFYFFILLLFLGCKNLQYKEETEVWNCLTDYAQLANVDLDAELRSHEAFLVEKGILTEASGAGYLGFLKNAVDTNVLSLPPDNKDWLEALREIGAFEGNVMDCQPQLNKQKITIVRKVTRMTEMIEAPKNISPQYIGEVMLSGFTETDMEQPLYRFLFFEIIESYVTTDNGIERISPPPPVSN